MSGLNAPADFVRLALMIDRHFPGYVDAYFGPQELRAEAMEGGMPPLALLQDSAVSIAKSISADPNLSHDRRAFLEEELRSMRTTLRILAGDAPAFVDEVRLLYGVTPAWVDERVFEEAHRTSRGHPPWHRAAGRAGPELSGEIARSSGSRLFRHPRVAPGIPQSHHAPIRPSLSGAR